MLQERASRLCRRHALAGPYQKASPQRLFHMADARRRRRQGKVRPLRPMGNASRFHNVAKQTQVDYVETHNSIQKSGSFVFHEDILRQLLIACYVSEHYFVYCETRFMETSMADAKMTERPISPHLQIYRWS